VLSLSSLIEFLLDMLRDPATQNDFARDPNATLAARGLSGVTAQDIQDVQPMLADHTGVSASLGGAHAVRSPDVEHAYAGGAHGVHSSYHPAVHADPVPAIQHITNEYEVDRSTVVRNVTQEYKQYATYKTYLTDNSIHAENGGTVIQDSFNQDNDGIDLKGANVDSSVLAGHDANGSGNTTTTTTTEGSNNDDHSTAVTGSHNSSADQDYANVGNDSSSHHDSHDSTDSHQSTDSHDSGDVNDSYGAHAAAAASADDGADVAAHHA
jgi:hypothetical protein